MTQEAKDIIAAEIIKLMADGMNRFAAVDLVITKYREAYRCSPDTEQNLDSK